MNIFKKITRKVKRCYYKPLKVFFFHQVGTDFIIGKDKKQLFTDLNTFKHNINQIKKKYTIVSLSEAQKIYSKKKYRKDNFAVITFDDAYSNIISALNYLEEMGIPATIFVNSKYLNQKSYGVINLKIALDSGLYEFSNDQINLINQLTSFDIQDNYIEKWETLMESISKNNFDIPDLYMDNDQISKLNKNLFTIGMHGYEHYNSKQLDNQAFLQNALKNRDELSQYPNYIPFFAFPYGLFNTNQIEILNKHNITAVLCYGDDNIICNKVISRICLDNVSLN